MERIMIICQSCGKDCDIMWFRRNNEDLCVLCYLMEFCLIHEIHYKQALSSFIEVFLLNIKMESI